MAEKEITLSQIKLFNPHEQSDDIVQKLFVARQKQYEFLIEKISREKTDSIPQHHLIIGQRGMGKTTLLKRIEVELRKGVHSKEFIPILMPEELYDLRSLSRFFITCLDRLADTLDRENNTPWLDKVEKQLAQLEQIDTDEDRIRQSFQALVQLGHNFARRPVILVDNIAMVFQALSKQEQHHLRGLLMENDAPILIAANARTFEASSEYNAPFYDAFQMHYLKKLSFAELKEILLNLSKITQAENIRSNISAHKGRLESLHQLTGGNPRTMTLLFRMIVKGFAEDIQDDLNAILDEVTPLYKDRFENLPDQMRTIVLAVAMHWDPIDTPHLRKATSLENRQLSPQLNRLLDSGWLMSEDEGKRKNKKYIISERLFNLWILMRQGTRREKKALHGLSRFLDLYYGQELKHIAQTRLGMPLEDQQQIDLNRAIAQSIHDEPLKNKLNFESQIGQKLLDNKENELAAKFIINGKYLEALAVLDKLIAKNMDNARLISTKAMVLMTLDKSNYNEAENLLLKAININEKFSTPWFGLGNFYSFYSDQFDKAEEAYLIAIKYNNKYPMLFHQLGDLYQNHLQQFDKAESAYLQAIEIDKTFVHSLNSLGKLYRNHLNEFEKAESAFLKAVQIDDIDANLWNSLGNLYQDHLNEFDKAENAYLKAIHIDENFAAPWNGLGILYLHLNEYEKAESAYLKAIHIDENSAYPWYNLGNLYQDHLNDFEKAETAYLKAIQIDENFAYPWNGLGNLYQDHLHQLDKAEQAYVKAIEIDDSNIIIRHNLIFLYRDKLHQIEKAQNIFKDVEPEESDIYFIQKSLFNLYNTNLGLAKENIGKALQIINGAFPVYTQDDWWRYGAIVYKLGHTEWYLDILKEKQMDSILAPYFIALHALNSADPEAHFMTVAIEKRPVAREIMKKMLHYLSDKPVDSKAKKLSNL